MSSNSIVPVGPHPLFALLMHLGHKMQQRVEAAPIPLGLRPRHVIAMTMLRDRGAQSQQALAAAMQVFPTNGMLSVPLNYANPAGPHIQIAVSKLEHTSSAAERSSPTRVVLAGQAST